MALWDCNSNVSLEYRHIQVVYRFADFSPTAIHTFNLVAYMAIIVFLR